MEVSSNDEINDIFSVIAPGTIRPNYPYHVAISTNKAKESSQIQVSIEGPDYNVSKTIEIKPMSTEVMQFDTPNLVDGQYKLTAVALSGGEFQASNKLLYAGNAPLPFVQTDKATYKPGDLVHFRVLLMNELLRPAKVTTGIDININDNMENRIKQFPGVALKNGVFTGKFLLSEQPPLGEWSINVLLDGVSLTRKSFAVDKYILPKFKVTIETETDVYADDTAIRAAIIARYTYGKSAKGVAKVSLSENFYMCFGSQEGQVKCEKTVNVDGKTYVEFDMKNELGVTSKELHFSSLVLKVEFEEDLTGYKSSAKSTIVLHSEKYKVECINPPHEYRPEVPLTFKISIKNLNNTPVNDTTNQIKLIAKPSADAGELVEESANIDNEGFATFELTLPDTEHYYDVQYVYLNQSSYITTLSRYSSCDISDNLRLYNLSHNPSLHEKVCIEIRSPNILSDFIYLVIGRGKILKVEHVKVTEALHSYKFGFMPTFEMVPQIDVFVYCVHGKQLLFDSVNISIKRESQNFIKISSRSEVEPGDLVDIEINTNPDSFVGLLGVDQSVLLLKSGNDINLDNIYDSLSTFTTCTHWDNGFNKPGSSCGLVFLTNAELREDGLMLEYCQLECSNRSFVMNSESPRLGGANYKLACMASDVVPEIQVRKNFVENWIFEDIDNVEGGNVVLKRTIPDTITSWVITGFSINSSTGFAITEIPTNIKTFRPFFLSTNLPYSIKRGEEISIPVLIFNYLDKPLETVVTLENNDDEFEFTDEGEKPNKRIRKITAEANEGQTVLFAIRPKRIGNITLKITAVSPLAGDSVHKLLKVEPEGITIYRNYDYYLQLKDVGDDFKQTTTLDIPKDIVPDSEYIEVSVMGNLLGSTINNLDALIQMPYGCGEQNMVNFVPNILVLYYLEAVNQLTTSIKEKAIRFMEIGYQRELTYKHDDGSYSAFGESDNSGSTWLTAYVMRSFRQATKFIDIDPNILRDGMSFLAQTQDADGGFVERGVLFDFSHHNKLGLTAYVLLAFLENIEYLEQYQNVIDLGFNYLKSNVKSSDDLYAVSVALYAMQRHGDEGEVQSLLTVLNNKARVDCGYKWWSKENEIVDDTKHYAANTDLQITAYVLMSLLDRNETALSTAKWLISQRNSSGGFTSSQDTVLGLEALIKFAQKTDSGETDCVINFSGADGNASVAKFEVNEDNTLVLQSHKIASDTRSVTFNGKGSGAVVIQISYRYNIFKKEVQPSFKVNSKLSKIGNEGNKLTMDVTVEFLPSQKDHQNNKSNMSVLEVALPSGYAASTDAFGRIEDIPNVKRIETKNEETTIVIYFDYLTAGDVKTVPIEGVKLHDVTGQKPSPIVVYDYYDTKKRATVFYEI
ncbi:CD109 antigen-like [Teleopsis dalmanni]|uniref:CD109 antigen-like n=1 Tax=Teleopsis dalmanni TaxID=139649 RepID=UPI0018CCD340|nr:CD109 antigen-like [Teleopsis dalmanni]